MYLKSALLFIYLLLFSSLAFAKAPLCSNLFLESASPSGSSDVTAIGDSKEPRYIPTGAIRALKAQRPQNQCKTSECYLFSYVGMLETANLNVNSRPDAPKISAPYLFAQKMYEWSKQAAWNQGMATTHSFKGGFFPDSLALTRKFGLVPEESWTPKVAFEQWDFAQFYNDIKSISARSNRTVYGNLITNAFNGGYGKDGRTKRYHEILPELTNAIEKWTGPLPTTVDFRGKTLSVKDIERQYGIDHRTAIEMMYPEGKWTYDASRMKTKFDDAVTTYGGSYRYGPKPMTEIEQRIIRWLKKGAPVMVELNWGKSAHALIIVGYEAHNGTVTRWKLQNSWGSQWSDHGSAWYTPHDLRQNLKGAYFVDWAPAPASTVAPFGQAAG